MVNGSFSEFLTSCFSLCHHQNHAIKVHPQHFSIPQMLHADLFSTASTSVPINSKCSTGGVTGFKRFVILRRHPFDAIWTEYQRQVTGGKSSTQARSTFDRMHFADYLLLAAGKEVTQTPLLSCFSYFKKPKLTFFSRGGERMLDRYLLNYTRLKILRGFVPKQDILDIRYENIFLIDQKNGRKTN